MATPIEKLMGGVVNRNNRLAATRLLGQLGSQDIRPESEMLQDPNFQELSQRFPEKAESFRNERQAIREALKVEDEESEKAFFRDMRSVKTRLEANDLTGAKQVLLDRRIKLNQIPGSETDDVDRILNRLENEDFQGAYEDLVLADEAAIRNGILPAPPRATLTPGSRMVDGTGTTIANNPSAAGGARTPASVTEFQFFQSLDPEDQELFLQVQRGQQAIDLGDRTIIPSRTDPTQIAAEFEEGISPEQQPENVAARTTAEDTAASRVERAFNAGSARNVADAVVDNSQRLISSVDEILNHPGLAAATGLSAILDPSTVLPGAEANDARTLINQLKDRIFVDALNAMRAASRTGGAVGAVSDAEGARLENMFGALSRMQSEEQFLEQLKLIRKTAEDMVKRTNDAFAREFEGFSGSGDPELDAVLQAIEEQNNG